MSDEVEIRGESIRLGQLLKVAGVVDSGAEAKALLRRRRCAVNGEARRVAAARSAPATWSSSATGIRAR